MTPRKTIYISEKDAKTWERAEELAGTTTSLSALLAQLLHDYVTTMEQRPVRVRESVEALREALGKLTVREHQVLDARFGLEDNNPRTLREIGDALGISPERVRQIENEALRKVRRSTPPRALAGLIDAASKEAIAGKAKATGGRGKT